MTNKTNPRKDFTQTAFNVFQQAIGEAKQEELTERQINSRKGGLKGGKTRMQKLSKQEKSDLGKSAINKRWDKTASSIDDAEQQKPN